MSGAYSFPDHKLPSAVSGSVRNVVSIPSLGWEGNLLSPSVPCEIYSVDKPIPKAVFEELLRFAKVLITDLDDTAFDSHVQQRLAWNYAINNMFVPLDRQMEADVAEAIEWVRRCFAGQDFNDLAHGLFQILRPYCEDEYATALALDHALGHDRSSFLKEAERRGDIKEVPGYRDFVRMLIKGRNLVLAINTSSPKAIAMPMMRRLAPELIDWSRRYHKIFRDQHPILAKLLPRLVSEDSPFQKKPYTDTYDALLGRLNCPKERAIILEDCPKTVANLLQAGYPKVVFRLCECYDTNAVMFLSGCSEEQLSRLIVVRDFRALPLEYRRAA